MASPLNEINIREDLDNSTNWINDVDMLDPLNPRNVLKLLKSRNTERIIISQININSLRYKFNELVSIIHGNVDILIITETKLDDTFTNSQFKIEGFSYPYRLDRTKEGLTRNKKITEE